MKNATSLLAQPDLNANTIKVADELLEKTKIDYLDFIKLQEGNKKMVLDSITSNVFTNQGDNIIFQSKAMEIYFRCLKENKTFSPTWKPLQVCK